MDYPAAALRAIAGVTSVICRKSNPAWQPLQARTAFAKAVDNGILTKTGTGGATRYRYAPQLRAVK